MRIIINILIFILFTMTLQADKKPEIPFIPLVKCVERGNPYSAGFYVRDSSLCDTENPEMLVIEVVSPEGFTVDPDTIRGPVFDNNGNCNPDSLFYINVSTENFDYEADENYYVTVNLKVTDKDGNIATKPFKTIISEQLMWQCRLQVYNKFDFEEKDSISYYSSRELIFGEAPPESDASTGDGRDGNPVYSIDWQLCEKPAPPKINSLTARWLIGPNEFFRVIYPYFVSTGAELEYNFYANESLNPDNGEQLWPLAMGWNMLEIPDIDDKTRNPDGYKWILEYNGNPAGSLSIDMRTLEGSHSKSFEIRKSGNWAFIKYYGGQTDGNPDNKWFKIKRVNPTGFSKKLRLIPGMRVYPNPADDYIAFMAPDSAFSADLSIIDCFGKEIVSKKIDIFAGKECRIELEKSNSAGLYYCRVRYRKQLIIMPFIIIK